MKVSTWDLHVNCDFNSLNVKIRKQLEGKISIVINIFCKIVVLFVLLSKYKRMNDDLRNL